MKIAFPFAATSAITLFALSAWAECDPACPEGFVCEEFSTGCPAIDVYCPAGQDCEPQECEPTTETACTPAPCTTDDDCGTDLVCLETETMACTAVDCAPDEECEVEEPQCEPQIERFCAPRWVGPCETAADCGEGFDCVAEESCWCSGSSPAYDPDEDPGDSAPATPDEPNCGCGPTGEMMCQAQEIDCSSGDDACPEAWNCIDNPNGVCTASTDGTSECFTDGPERVCAPPYYDLLDGGATYGAHESDQVLAANTDPAARDELGQDDADATGTEQAADDSSESGGGCSVTTGSPAASGWLLALLTLVPVARRRRRR